MKQKKAKGFRGLQPQERPITLPGGRKWRNAKDAMNEEMIAEIISSQAELIMGSTLGYAFWFIIQLNFVSPRQSFFFNVHFITFHAFILSFNSHHMTSRIEANTKVHFWILMKGNWSHYYYVIHANRTAIKPCSNDNKDFSCHLTPFICLTHEFE